MEATGACHMNLDDTAETKIAEIQHQLKMAGMDSALKKFEKILQEGRAEVFGVHSSKNHLFVDKKTRPTREKIGAVDETIARMKLLAEHIE